MKVLAIDVGGTKVKFKVWGQHAKRSFPSGPEMTPHKMLEQLKSMTSGWRYDAVLNAWQLPFAPGFSR